MLQDSDNKLGSQKRNQNSCLGEQAMTSDQEMSFSVRNRHSKQCRWLKNLRVHIQRRFSRLFTVMLMYGCRDESYVQVFQPWVRMLAWNFDNVSLMNTKRGFWLLLKLNCSDVDWVNHSLQFLTALLCTSIVQLLLFRSARQ